MADELKLYRVTIEATVYVIATSRDDAADILASSDGRDVLADDVRENATVFAREAPNAEDNSYPWRAEGAEEAPDRTVSEWARITREVIAREKRDAEAKEPPPSE